MEPKTIQKRLPPSQHHPQHPTVRRQSADSMIFLRLEEDLCTFDLNPSKILAEYLFIHFILERCAVAGKAEIES